jgi:HlyD family secretion protein
MKNPFQNRLALLLFSAAIIAAGIITYWWIGNDRQPQYRLQAAEMGDIIQTVSANGTINPVTLVSVGTQVSGTVKRLYVDFNSKVQKSQVLLELDDALLAAQLKQSEANVQSAEASLDLATANEQRAHDLFTQDYVSRQELDSAVQAKKSAEAQLQLAHATVEKDRANLAYSIIRSPVSGVVVDRQVDVGQTVAASLQTPTLFKIAQDLSRMQIDANFAEADIGSIRIGQSVRFTVDAFPSRNFTGEVNLIRLNPATVSNVVTYDVVISVANPEQILLPGMTAYVNVVLAEKKNVMLVPNSALRFKPADAEKQKPASAQGKDFENKGDVRADVSPAGGKRKQDAFSGKIYKIEKGNLKQVNVTLGITDNRNTEIIGGEIKAGDQIVIGDGQTTSNSQSGSSSPMRMRMF